MIHFHPPLPEFPPLRTTPMDPATRRRLEDAMQECRKMQAYPKVKDHLHRGYAMLWVNLALERGMDPRKVLGPGSRGHQVVLKVFLQACAHLGIHERATIERNLILISHLGARLWQEAKEAQAMGIPPVAGLGLEPSADAEPGGRR